MKKMLCALCCVGAMYAADTLNQVELNLGNASSHKGLVNVQFQYKDADKVGAKLFLGYQGLSKELKNGNLKDNFKTKKNDYEISAYLGNIFLDNGKSDLAGYLIGGYHFSRVNYNGDTANADGFIWGGQLEVMTNITEVFRAGASAEYKSLYSGKKEFNGNKLKVKDDRVEVLARVDAMMEQGFYVGGKIGMQKKKMSVGDSDFDKNQFVFYLTAGTIY